MRLLLLLASALCFVPRGSHAASPDPSPSPLPDASLQNEVTKRLFSIDWSEIERIVSALPEEVRALWENRSAAELAERFALDGTLLGEDLALENGYKAALSLLLTERKRLSGLFCSLVGVSLLGAFCRAAAGEKGGVSELAAFVSRCFTLTALLAAFLSCAGMARDCANTLGKLIEWVAPILLTLLTAMGCTAGVGVFAPTLSLLAGGVAGAMKTAVIPLALCGGVLGMFDALSERAVLGEMSALIKSAVKWVVGAVTTLFLGITGVRGMMASSFDRVSVRAARFAAGSAAPMVGSLVTGTFDTALGAAGLVKNAAGVTAMLFLSAVALVPLLRLAAYMLLVRLCAALIQPIADKKQVGMLRAGADMLSVLLSACVAVSIMFIVSIGLVTGLNNGGYWG